MALALVGRSLQYVGFDIGILSKYGTPAPGRISAVGKDKLVCLRAVEEEEVEEGRNGMQGTVEMKYASPRQQLIREV